MPIRSRFGIRIAGISVSQDGERGIIREDPFDFCVSRRRPIRDRGLPRMERIPHADAPAVMKRDPTRAGGSIEKRIENRPVGDRVARIAHAFRFPVGRGD